jgi:hypothetical protein
MTLSVRLINVTAARASFARVLRIYVYHLKTIEVRP